MFSGYEGDALMPDTNSIARRDGEDPSQREVTANAPSSSENLSQRLSHKALSEVDCHMLFSVGTQSRLTESYQSHDVPGGTRMSVRVCLYCSHALQGIISRSLYESKWE